jgi:hypothetical protein
LPAVAEAAMMTAVLSHARDVDVFIWGADIYCPLGA